MILHFFYAYFFCKITFHEKNQNSGYHFWLFGIIGKNHWKPIYRHFSDYQQKYQFDRWLPQIISDLKESSAKLSLSKMTGESWTNCSYWRKNAFRHTPNNVRTEVSLIVFSKIWGPLLIFKRNDVVRIFSNYPLPTTFLPSFKWPSKFASFLLLRPDYWPPKHQKGRTTRKIWKQFLFWQQEQPLEF